MKLSKQNISFPYKASINNKSNKIKNLLLNTDIDITNNKAHSIPLNNKKQKEFYHPQPIRPYERFLPTKISLSGLDPSGNLLEFISNDIIHPIKRPNLYTQKFKTLQNNKIENTISRWALKTTARPNDYKSLPKLQPFTSYYFPPKYNNKNIEKYRNFTLKTDHIGIKVPRTEKVCGDKSFIKLKTDFYFNTETKKENEWAPRAYKNSINNISSQNYDIINFQPLTKNNQNSLIMNRTLFFKKKCIGEFTDLTKTFTVNFNKEFSEKINKNPNRFRIYNGIFSDMYDASHKNGDISPPFGNNKKK